jgi:hypothetical protein
MAGGAGVEYYFGYALPQNDLLCEDWRSRERSWGYAAAALRFFASERIPFHEMEPADALVGNAAEDDSVYALAKPDAAYLVYLPKGGQARLDLAGARGSFRLQWFDPRHGGGLASGGALTGGGTVTLGPPPSEAGEDWLAVVRRPGPSTPAAR